MTYVIKLDAVTGEFTRRGLERARELANERGGLLYEVNPVGTMEALEALFAAVKDGNHGLAAAWELAEAVLNK